jgi:hypothetical protein
MRQKIAYLLANPVRKELVRRWQDYSWIWQNKPLFDVSPQILLAPCP